MPIINPPPIFVNGNAGLVPDSDDGTTKFLRADGSFSVPSGGGSAAAWHSLDVNGDIVTPGTPAWTHSSAISNLNFVGLGNYESLFVVLRSITLVGSGAIQYRFSTDNGITWDDGSNNYFVLTNTGSRTGRTAGLILGSTNNERAGSMYVPISKAIGAGRMVFTQFQSIPGIYVGSPNTISGIQIIFDAITSAGSIYLYGLS